MPEQPQYTAAQINAGSVGWSGRIQGTLDDLESHLSDRPTQTRWAYRQSGSNPEPSRYLSLVNFPAANYVGHRCWVLDAGTDANAPGGPNLECYSDGTNWRYYDNDLTVTIS